MKHKAPALLILVLFVATACATSTASSSSPTPASTPTIAVIPTPTPVPHSKVGESVVRDGFEITFVSVKTIDPASISQHEEIYPSITSDQTFLVLQMHVKNTTTEDQDIGSTQFVLQDDAGGHDYAVQLGIDGVGSDIGGTVAPSMQLTGSRAYIVPKATHHFFLLYEATVGSQVIWDINI